MKTKTCYHCKSSNNSFYAEENGFILVKCNECGLLYLANRPDDDEISQAHKQGKHKGTNELDVTGSFSNAKISTYLNILQDIYRNELNHIDTWLDIGCGHGEFMSAIKTYSGNAISIKGTEPNKEKQESARRHNLDVGFFDLEHHGNRYDAISLLNVYSHLPNPPTFIQNLKNLLNPGGELLLETGDTANFNANEHYRPFYLPDHLSFASEKIIVDLLESSGFEILSIKKYPYIKSDIKSFAKEAVKAFLPGYHSKLKYYLHRNKYAQTDMYIRARLKI